MGKGDGPPAILEPALGRAAAGLYRGVQGAAREGLQAARRRYCDSAISPAVHCRHALDCLIHFHPVLLPWEKERWRQIMRLLAHTLAGRVSSSKNSGALHAVMPIAAKNDVIMDGHAELGRDLDDLLRHFDVGL